MSIEKISVESKKELEQTVTKEISQIERGLTEICSHVPVDSKTAIDILCHDDDGQLVVLQLSVDENDSMLLQGIQSLDYVDRFKSFLKATYNKHKINDEEKPRLILVAPSFSETLRNVIEHMQGMRIDLYEWEYLKLGDQKGLRLQPLFAGTPKKPMKEEKPKPIEKKRETKPEKKKEKLPEKKEEPKPEPEPEPPKEVFPKFPLPTEEPEEEEPEPEKKKAPPRRKLKLF